MFESAKAIIAHREEQNEPIVQKDIDYIAKTCASEIMKVIDDVYKNKKEVKKVSE
jgi:uncharacterized protein (DUF1499 family)